MTTRLLTRATILCFLGGAIGCSTPPPAPKRAEARPAASPVGKRDARHLGEESLGGPSSREATPAAAVQPPDPQTVVASIGPSTSPQRAASIHLTDEGRRLLEKDDTKGAVDRLEKAVKIDPSNAHGYYWLAQVYDRSGRPDQALAFVDKSIVLFAQDDPAWLAQAYTFRASILERTGRFKDARTSYRRALQVEPGSVAARAGIARLGEIAPAP